MDKTMNAEKVLANVNSCIAELEKMHGTASWKLDYNRFHIRGYGYNAPVEFKIRAVYDELSIFDWWPETLSMSRLKQMKQFLETAIKYGYKGYVCFKVGSSGCANGMWAHKNESTDGYSPDGEVLYRSFTPDYVTWDAQLADGKWVGETYLSHKKYTDRKLNDIKRYIGE